MKPRNIFGTLALVVTLSLMGCAGATKDLITKQIAAITANQNASAKTQQVLAYLKGLPNRKDNRVVSGQFQENLDGHTPFNEIYAQAGKYPGLMGTDYGPMDVVGTDFSIENSFLISHWNNGGLVTIDDVMSNPVTGRVLFHGGGWDTTYVDFNQMLTPGTSLNNVFNAELDRIAIGLNDLQSNDVVVLFRPYMEMNGGWFWWGEKDFKQFKDLWIYTFNYLTRTKSLHNLLWVYAPSCGFGNDLNYYPGNQYVDVVGCDAYGNMSASNAIGDYNELVTTGKPFALTEFGPCLGDAPSCPAQDYSQLIAGIKQNIPNTVYWLSWNSIWAMSNHLNVSQLFNDPWVVTRGEINLPAGGVVSAPTRFRVGP